MKAYKVTLLIVDHWGVREDIPSIIENVRYPNTCVNPQVMEIESVDIGEWDDDHPLNSHSTQKEHFEKIFPSN